VRGYSKVAPAPGQSVPRSDHLALVLGAMASLGALCVVAGFDFVLHLPVFAVVAALLLGVLAAPDPMAAAL
ncbi:MAG TPA: hypothetical protein PLA50_19270, partial [Bacteroidia bacterium]|nr:hypothetical protein [Bacteroidia bacterium]